MTSQGPPILPVDSHIPWIINALHDHGAAVLVAPPGTGKTTRVPPAMLEAPFRKASEEIAVLEPRRLAAKLTAERVCEEMSLRTGVPSPIGELIGYSFRGERRVSARTRLCFYTEGTLLRRMMNDPTLKGVAAVILDEFHERHLQGDLALSFLQYLRKTSRPDLKILVMSATMDAGSVAQFLDHAPVISVEAKTYPVTLRYLPRPADRSLDAVVERAVGETLVEVTSGDLLVFLPGYSDIRKVGERLQGVGGRQGPQVHVAPLHGALSRAEQDFAVSSLPPEARARGERKVILATNIAETSLTLPDITAVIDSGYHRQASFSFWSGVPLLATKAVSRASAIQRAGRAGRVGPGFCYRLYTQADFEGRMEYEPPEIRRADLAQTLLELKAFGVDDVGAFPWFQAPEESRLQAAVEVLHRLGATVSADLDAPLTPQGRRLAQVPTHPRFARALMEAHGRGIHVEVAKIIALLESGDLRSAPGAKAFDVASVGLDGTPLRGMARVEANRFEAICAEWSQMQAFEAPGSAPGAGVKSCTNRPVSERREAIARSLLAGFPDRIAMKKTGPRGPELYLSSGGTARGSNKDHLFYEDFYVVIDVQETKGQDAGQGPKRLGIFTVHGAAPIKEDWLLDLDPSPLKDKTTLIWDKSRGRVYQASRMLCDQLVMSETTSPAPASEKTTVFMLAEAFGLRLQSLRPQSFENQWGEIKQRLPGTEFKAALEEVLAKLVIISDQLFQQKPLIDVVIQLLGPCHCLDDLGATDLTSRMLELVDPEVLPHINRILPERITLPNGRKTKIHYELGKNPWIESRLQDFFGLAQTPTINNGTIKLTLHLLAPNGRAVQVTQDLQSFWNRTYAEVRKELLRRYPRHKWPEDPKVYLKDDGE